MEWGVIMLHGRTDLFISVCETITNQRYSGEILLPHVNLIRSAIGLESVFMSYNTRPHRTAQEKELLERDDIRLMEWPAGSLDLNPSSTSDGVAARPNASITIQPMSNALIEE
ncbi:unnamed protein product [Haemonchus placei]|uniref:Integrase catalytic domain-containing protein n=1 Tax=Haemonchus placei TaxID=6290 RepID=A0A0N4VWY8_HAEPC|nr:unnamed protein product [Haemonchus placei]